MAEAVISVIAGFVLERVSSLGHEDISLLWGLQVELGKLKQTVSRIHAVLLDAEEKRDLSHQDEWFVRELKDVFYDADDLLDLISFDAAYVAVEGRQETKTAFNALANRTCMFFSKPKYASSLKKIRRKLDSIVKDLDIRIDPSQRRRPTALLNRETFSVEHEELVIGRDEDAAAIKKLLLDTDGDAERASLVSIVGIGGLGKTTLARLVFNHSQVEAQFGEKIWVCVSEEFDVKTIFSNIIESLTLRKPEISQMDSLQQDLRQRISGKKYLLVLDDIWNDNEESWNMLKAPLSSAAKGSKIIITTRSTRVASAARAKHTHILEGLSEENSWDFFRKTAFKESQESNNDDLIRIGKNIVKHCAGVPLAIKAMGRLLSNTRPVEWQQFQELPSVIQGGGDSTFLILKLSYDHLQPNLKQCFAYCALFQKDERIKKETLIRLWIAQGFVQSSELNQTLEDVGNQYFMHLLHMSFFQEAHQDSFGSIMSIKMHDLMHDLATSIAESECVFLNRHTKIKGEKIRHLSFNNISTLKMAVLSKVFEVEKVRTLSSNYYGPLKESAFNTLMISSMQCLRVLNLCGMRMKILPEFISRLKHLRYLDLSTNKFKIVPNSIAHLLNLQTLDLSFNWHLKKLPRDIKNLKNLRHLILEGCGGLVCLPRGICELNCIQTLSKFVVCEEASRCSAEITELTYLNNLRGALIIKNSRNERSISWPDILKDKRTLEVLVIDFGGRSRDHNAVGDEALLEGVIQLPNLKSLRLTGYDGKGLPQHLHFYMPMLVKLVISNSACKCLPNFSFLPCLNSIVLSDLNELTGISPIVGLNRLESITFKNLISVREIPSLSQLPHLKFIKFEQLIAVTKFSSLSEIPCLESIELQALRALTSLPSLNKFPCLKKLRFAFLNSLADFPSLSQLPCLDHIEIVGLRALTSLPSLNQFPCLKKIRFMYLDALAGFPSLSQLPCLDHIELADLSALTSFPSLNQFPCLEYIGLTSLIALTKFPSLSQLPCLRKIRFEKLNALIDFPSLSQLPCLESIYLRGLSALTSLPSLTQLPCLKNIEFDQLDALTDFPSLSQLPCLKDIRLRNMSSLTNFPLLTKLPCLERVHFNRMTLLQHLPRLVELPSLKHIDLWNLHALEELPPLHQLPCLESLTVVGLNSIEYVQDMYDGQSSMTTCSSFPSHSNSAVTMPHPPSLKSLMLQDLPKLKGWWKQDKPSLSTVTPPPQPHETMESLRRLHIRNCPELESLPHWMSQLTSLQRLLIRGCPKLQERCRVDEGADWPNIAHIPRIDIRN